MGAAHEQSPIRSRYVLRMLNSCLATAGRLDTPEWEQEVSNPTPYTPVIEARDVDDLRERIARTRWPKPIDPDSWERGVPQTFIKPLASAWENFAFDRWVSDLRQLPHFSIELDGSTIHFLHYRSERADARPIILTHGWPSSFLEFVGVASLLTNPPAGIPAFHVVVPSLPGHGFSQAPAHTGFGVREIAALWVELMGSLGYDKFIAQGGDWGSYITALLGANHPENIEAIHLSMPFAPKPEEPVELDERDQAAVARMMGFGQKRSGYAAIQSSRPATLAYALEDSPAGHLAWISERLWEWADHEMDLEKALSTEFVLGTASLYWFQHSAGPAAHLFWESFSDMPADEVTVPVGCSVTKNDAWMPRAWCEKRFTNVTYWKDLPEGGHFLAAERPDLYVAELRTFVSALDNDRSRRRVEIGS